MKEKIKVYTYTRVSTAMQIDGYSLEAQKNRMKAYADFNDYEIVGNTKMQANPANLSKGEPSLTA